MGTKRLWALCGGVVICVVACGGRDETWIYADSEGALGGSTTRVDSLTETGDDVAPDSAAPDSALAAALAEPALATALCRWVAVTSSSVLANAEGSAADCEARWSVCDESSDGSSGVGDDSTAVVQAASVVASLPQLLAAEGCDLPPVAVDRCAAELLLFLTPAVANVTCESPELVLPTLSLGSLAQLPSCLSLVPSCPQILSILTESGGTGG